MPDWPAEAVAIALPDRWLARSWTLGFLLAAAVAVPLVFDPVLGDAFALPKLIVLYILITSATAGPLVDVAARGAAALRSWKPQWLDGIAVSLALLALLSTAFSSNPAHSVLGEPLQYQGLLTWLLYLAGFALARFLAGGSDDHARSLLRWVFAALTIAGGIAAAYAVAQQAGLDPVWHTLDKGRVFSTLGQANALAAYLVLALPGAVALALLARGSARWLAWVSMLLMLGALLLTYSRGGYLALAAEAGVLLVLAARARGVFRRHVVRAGIALALAFALVWAAAPLDQLATKAWARAASIDNLQETSIQDHLDLWAVGARIAIDHPLLGTGPDSYALVFPAYRADTLPAVQAARLARFRPESPHNIYLAIASGLGLVALIAYLLVIAGSLRGVLRTLTGRMRGQVLAAALLAALIGHLVTDLFMTGDLSSEWLFWVLLGSAAALVRLAGPAASAGEPAVERNAAPPDGARQRVTPGRDRQGSRAGG
jgi:O-antigen ligase